MARIIGWVDPEAKEEKTNATEQAEESAPVALDEPPAEERPKKTKKSTKKQ